MKKIVVFTVAFAVLAAGTVVAIPMNVGGGVNMATESIDFNFRPTATNSSNEPGSSLSIREDTIGASLFFDVYYACLSLELAHGARSVVGYDTSGDAFFGSYDATIFNAQLLGKFPLPLYSTDSIRIFPMFGVGYQASAEKGAVATTNMTGDLFDGTFNNFRLFFGIGADFDVTKAVFVRVQALPYYHFPMDVPMDFIVPQGTGSVKVPGGFGLNGSLAIGFKIVDVQGSGSNSRQEDSSPATTPAPTYQVPQVQQGTSYGETPFGEVLVPQQSPQIMSQVPLVF